MSTTKPFLSIDGQLKLLQSRGLSINKDEYEKAKAFFLSNNYYRISGYSLTLRKNDVFNKDASFDTLIQIYEADRRMRHIMLSIIEVVEVKIKSLVAYYYTEKYGPLGYLNINTFNCSDSIKNKMYTDITTKANSQKTSITEFELFLKHHRDNKNDELPFWVYVEVLTLSDISKLYTILDVDLQLKVALQLNFYSTNRYKIVENLLHCVTILRNICAHGGRLYNRLFITKPGLSKTERTLLRNENGHIVFDKLFSYILVLKSLTTPHEFKIVYDHMKDLFDEYKLTDFKHYGFPDNWQEIL